MTSHAIRSVVAGVLLLTSPAFLGPVHGTQFEPFERTNKASLALQEEITRLSIEPVVAALKRATGADSPLGVSLSKIRFTATPHLMRPANAYATPEFSANRGALVEIDLSWFTQAFAFSRIEAFRIIDATGERRLAYRAGQAYGERLAASLKKGESLPNFMVVVKDHVTDPLELAFVTGLGTRLTDEAMAWTILHELAHHHLGHLSADRRVASQARSRQMELDADAWASRTMVDLRLPLHGVKVFMDFMVALAQIHQQLGLALPDESSTHPSWERRRDALVQQHDAFASSNENWLIFSAPLNVDAPAGTNIKQISYAFPKDPVGFGACLGVVRLGDVQEFAAAERIGPAIHLYQANPEELISVEIPEPHRSLSPIVTTITSRATGERQQGRLLAWQLPMALYGAHESGGIQVAEAMRFSPKALLADALKQTVREAASRTAMTAAFERRLTIDCELGIAFVKGALTEREMLQRSQAAATAYANETTSILGASGAARLQAVLQQHPIVQKGLQLLKK